jgi:hypothetical protein
MKMGRGSMAAEAKLKQRGMKTTSPNAVDKSMKPSGGRVNNEPTRSGTAPTPKTLGPRN